MEGRLRCRAGGQQTYFGGARSVRLRGIPDGGMFVVTCRRRKERGDTAPRAAGSSKPHRGQRLLQAEPVGLKSGAWFDDWPLHWRAHRCELSGGAGLTFVTAILQGTTVARLGSRLNLASLVDAAREGMWDIRFLSDMHMPPEQARSLVRIEDYTLVLGGMCGIMLSASLARLVWRTGASPMYCESGRRPRIALASFRHAAPAFCALSVFEASGPPQRARPQRARPGAARDRDSSSARARVAPP